MSQSVAASSVSLASLYEQDETAWLEQMASLIAEGRLGEIDREHLCEYLADMARRDRREVYNRLVVLLSHLLKWDKQPDERSRSWTGTIISQRQELRQLLESGSLRRHANEILVEAYADAVERAAGETGLEASRFARECPYTLDEVLQGAGGT